MLDIRLIRSDPDRVRAALARRDPALAESVNRLLELDEQWRAATAQLEELRAEQNQASRGRRGAPTPEEREQLAELAARGRALSETETARKAELDAALVALPSLPSDDAPAEDTVLREVGEAGKTGRDHLELAGERIDIERGARLSGSRFAYLKGDLVILEQALYGTGFLPDTEQQIYSVDDDDLYLVGTSEVALASLHREEILTADELPKRYAGFS